MTPEEAAEIAVRVGRMSEAVRACIVRLGDPKLPHGGLFQTELTDGEIMEIKRSWMAQWSTTPGSQGIICRLTSLGKGARAFLLDQCQCGDARRHHTDLAGACKLGELCSPGPRCGEFRLSASGPQGDAPLPGSRP